MSSNTDVGFDKFMHTLGFIKIPTNRSMESIVESVRKAIAEKIKAPGASKPEVVEPEADDGPCDCPHEGCHSCIVDEEGPFADTEVYDEGDQSDEGTLAIHAVGTSAKEFLEHAEWLIDELAKEYKKQSEFLNVELSTSSFKKVLH